MLNYIQSLLIVVIEVLCCKIFFEAFCEKRDVSKKIRNLFAIFLLILVIFVAGNFLKNYLFLKEFLIIGFTAILMYWVMQISILKSIILSVLFQALLLVMDYLMLLIAIALFGSTEEIERSYLMEGALIIVLGKSILFLCVALIKRGIGKKKAALLGDIEWGKFFFFPIFSMGTIIAMINAIGGMENQRAEEICYVISIGLVVMNIVVFYLLNDILDREYRIRESELFKLSVSNQMKLYRSVSENFEKQRKKTHEYKNQILCIDSLIASKNYAELENYVRDISGMLNKELDTINTNNVIVNAVLNTKYQEAIEKDILFVVKINDLNNLRISDEDMVVILANLLNNAIEACEKCDRKVIKLKFVKEEGSIIISVQNTYNGKLSYKDGKIVSTKDEEEDEHGIGINNIIDSIKKYDGSYLISDEKGMFCFSIMIPE